jgi:Cu2+-exporting ATPase
VIAIPIAAGVLYPSLGLLLRPEWAALAMSASTVTVTVNALLLNRWASTIQVSPRTGRPAYRPERGRQRDKRPGKNRRE